MLLETRIGLGGILQTGIILLVLLCVLPLTTPSGRVTVMTCYLYPVWQVKITHEHVVNL